MFIKLIPTFLISAVFGLANGAMVQFTGITIAFSDFDLSDVSQISAAYFGGWLIGSLVGPRILFRFNTREALTLSSALAAIGILTLLLDTHVTLWSVSRVVTGFAMGLYYVSIESWINHNSDNSDRGRSLGTYEAIRLVMTIIAPTVAILLININMLFSFIIMALLFLAAIPFILTCETPNFANHQAPLTRFSPRALVSRIPFFFSAIVAGGIFAGVNGFTPTYGESISLDQNQSASLIFSFVVGSALIQIPAGWFSDRFGRVGLLFLCGVVITGTTMVIALQPSPSLVQLIALHGVLGMGVGPLYASSVASAVDQVDKSDIISVNGQLLICYGLGGFLAPIFIGALVDNAKISDIYLIFSYMTSGIILIFAARKLVGTSA